MKLQDIETVRELAAKRTACKSVIDRIDAGEDLKLTIGRGGNEAGIVMTSATRSMLVEGIARDCNDEIARIDARLRALGVDDGTGPDDPPASPANAHTAEGGKPDRASAAIGRPVRSEAAQPRQREDR